MLSFASLSAPATIGHFIGDDEKQNSTNPTDTGCWRPVFRKVIVSVILVGFSLSFTVPQTPCDHATRRRVTGTCEESNPRRVVQPRESVELNTDGPGDDSKVQLRGTAGTARGVNSAATRGVLVCTSSQPRFYVECDHVHAHTGRWYRYCVSRPRQWV